MSTLPLKPAVDVYYNLGPIAAPRLGFNKGLIIGTSTVISAEQRLVEYSSTDEMLEAGFTTTSPEYLAATVYKAATSKPRSFFVGRQVAQAVLATISYNGPLGLGNTVTLNEATFTISETTKAESNEITINDLIAEIESAGGTATYTDPTFNVLFSNAINTVFDVQKMTGPDVGEVVHTAAVDAETPVEAFQACRVKSGDWYAGAFVQELKADEDKAICAYVESAEQSTTYFTKSSSEDIINKVEGNIFEQLQGLKYQRTIGTWETEAYTHIAAMGYAMGQTRDTANSSYTLALKTLPGTTTENLTSSQVTAIKSYKANVYINRGTYYSLYEDGTTFSGAYYDEIIQLDKLAHNIQLNVMDLIVSNPKIAQTEKGMTKILNTISNACNAAKKTGFIAPGIWTGSDILDLKEGDMLPNGYIIMSEPIDEQQTADREARKAPPIYVCIKLAGAIQSVLIEINVNR